MCKWMHWTVAAALVAITSWSGASKAVASDGPGFEINGGWAYIQFDHAAGQAVGWKLPGSGLNGDAVTLSIQAPLGIQVDGNGTLSSGALDTLGELRLEINGRDVVVGDLSFARSQTGEWLVQDSGNTQRFVFELANVVDEVLAASWSYRLDADLVISESFAREMGTPEAANAVVGSVRLRSGLSDNGMTDDDSVIAGGQGNPGPDVIVGDLTGPQNYGSIVNGIKPYAIGTTSCNIGTEDLDWFDFGTPTPTLHPVIGQNMYRLKDGQFEMLGQSWLKHGFCALQGTLCSNDCDAVCFGCCDQLGPGCSDPYSPSRNGTQSGLGPKWEIQPATGTIEVWPYSTPGSATAISGRLQVHVEDLQPDQNEGAMYFMEGQYVTQDDAGAENDWNNASYRRISIAEGTLNASFIGGTVRKNAAIIAWQAFDTDVELVPLDVEDDGRFIIGYKASDNGDGTWHYEYAVFNLNSHRAAKGFSIPVGDGAVISNVGFHDVDYHSTGMPYDLTDWANNIGSSSVTWEAIDANTNVNANALRWATLYNFRFDASTPPEESTATMTLHLPLGTTDTESIPVLGPSAAISDLSIVSSDPPNDAIDARQPSQPDGSDPAGWESVEITFDGDVAGMTAGDFSVTQDGGVGPAPSVLSVDIVDTDTVTVTLDAAIEAGAWTTITHADGGSVRLGYLPADVSGNATATAGDVLTLIDFLNGSGSLADYQTDIDRSGANTGADVLRTIDLLSGADTYDEWNLVSLP